MLNRNKIFKTVRDTTNSLNVSTGKKMDNFYTELMTYEDMVQKRYDKIKDILNTIKYHHNKIQNLDKNYTNAVFGGGGKSLDDLLKNVEDAIETIETIETLEKLQEFESFTNLAAKITTLKDMNVLKPDKSNEDQLSDINGNQVKASHRSYFKEAKEALSSLDTLFNSDNTKIDKAFEKIEKIKDPIVQYIKDYKLSREFIEVIKKGIIELKKQADTFRKNQKLKLDKYKNIIKEGDTRSIQAVKDDEDPNKDIDRRILQAYEENRKNLVFKMNKETSSGRLIVKQDKKANEYNVDYRQHTTEPLLMDHTLINNLKGHSFDTTDEFIIKKVHLVNSILPIYALFKRDNKENETTALTYYFHISEMDTYFKNNSEMRPKIYNDLKQNIRDNFKLVVFIKHIFDKKNKKNTENHEELIEKIKTTNIGILNMYNLNEADESVPSEQGEYGDPGWKDAYNDYLLQKIKNSDLLSETNKNSLTKIAEYEKEKATNKQSYKNLRELIGLSKFTSIIDEVILDMEQKTQTGGSDQIAQLKSTLNKIKININENIDKEDRVKQNQNQPKQNQPKQNDIVKSAKTMFGVNTQQDDEDNKITNSIISSIIENYEKERSSVNTIEDKIKLDTKFVDILDNLGLNLSDIFKINFEDKLAFIFFILLLHIVVYSIVESLIMNDYLTDIVYIMALYVGVYFLIMFILILILNKYVNYRMKSTLNYLNTDFNMQLITMHLFIVFMFYIIVLILSQHIDIFTAKDEDDKLQILYRIEVISSIIFIFSSVFVMLL